MTVLSENTWEKITELEGYRWVTKIFTKKVDVPIYRQIPEGKDIKEKTDYYASIGHLHTKVEVISLPNNREQCIVKSCWTNKDSYHEFETWYKENAAQRVKKYELDNDIRHEYNVKALESITTLEDFSRNVFTNKFAFRRNINFFDQKKIPEKQIIESIMQDAYKYVPILNCVYPFRIKIWGPEYKDMKKQLVLRSICGPNQHDFRPNGKYAGDWKKCEQIYDAWIKLVESLGRPELFDGYYFNNQIMAPYLVSYHPVPILPTTSQIKEGYVERRAIHNDGMIREIAVIGASMHGYGVSLLSANHGLYGSFTRNWITGIDSIKDTPAAMQPLILNNEYGSVPFVLGIGYKDEKIPYNGDANKGIKPGFEEIHFWQ
jgi:hypothetical protein